MQEAPPTLKIKMTLQSILFGNFVPPKTARTSIHKLTDDPIPEEKIKKKRPAPIQNRTESNEKASDIPISAPDCLEKGRERVWCALTSDEWKSWTNVVQTAGLSPTTTSRYLNDLVRDRKAVKKVVALRGNVRHWYYKRRTSADTKKVYSETLNRDAKIISMLRENWTTKESVAKKLKMEGTTVNHAFGRIRQQHKIEYKIEVTPNGRIYYMRLAA